MVLGARLGALALAAARRCAAAGPGPGPGLPSTTRAAPLLLQRRALAWTPSKTFYDSQSGQHVVIPHGIFAHELSLLNSRPLDRDHLMAVLRAAPQSFALRLEDLGKISGIGLERGYPEVVVPVRSVEDVEEAAGGFAAAGGVAGAVSCECPVEDVDAAVALAEAARARGMGVHAAIADALAHPRPHKVQAASAKLADAGAETIVLSWASHPDASGGDDRAAWEGMDESDLEYMLEDVLEGCIGLDIAGLPMSARLAVRPPPGASGVLLAAVAARMGVKKLEMCAEGRAAARGGATVPRVVAVVEEEEGECMHETHWTGPLHIDCLFELEKWLLSNPKP